MKIEVAIKTIIPTQPPSGFPVPFQMHGDKENDPNEQYGVITQEKPKLKRPDMYRVVMLNDDYTPMEFVVWILQTIFHKSLEESTRLMLDIHQNDKSTVGIYTHDIARTKVGSVHKLAEEHKHPLQCIMEVDGGISE